MSEEKTRIVHILKTINEKNEVIDVYEYPILEPQERHPHQHVHHRVHHHNGNHIPATAPVAPAPADNTNTDATDIPGSVQSSASDGAIGGDNLESSIQSSVSDGAIGSGNLTIINN